MEWSAFFLCTPHVSKVLKYSRSAGSAGQNFITSGNVGVKPHASRKGCSIAADLSHEQKAWREGFRNIAGVDETGRGPLAGPVVVSAVILGRNWNENHRLDDSKALKVKEREELYEIICQEALAVSTVSMSAELVDRLNVFRLVYRG